MNAMVVGGYSHQIKGPWADALRSVGVEIQRYYTADQDFRGLPGKLPKDIDVVLVVAGSCSHKASGRAKRAASAAGVRCETVSKDAARTVQWLRERGYEAPQETQETQEEPMPIADTTPPLWAEEPDVDHSPPLKDWLDRSQIAQLLPTLNAATFYNLAATATDNRPPVSEVRVFERTTKNGGSTRSQRRVLVWSMDEVEQIERLAIERRLIAAKPAKEPVGVPVTDQRVTDPPVTFEQASGHKPGFEPAGLDWLVVTLHNVTAELAAEATRERDEWKAKCEQAQVERDALKAQLERIKSALGV